MRIDSMLPFWESLVVSYVREVTGNLVVSGPSTLIGRSAVPEEGRGLDALAFFLRKRCCNSECDTWKLAGSAVWNVIDSAELFGLTSCA